MGLVLDLDYLRGHRLESYGRRAADVPLVLGRSTTDLVGRVLASERLRPAPATRQSAA